MNNKTILNIIHESASLLKVDLDSSILKSTEDLLRNYGLDEVGEFVRDLTEIANQAGLVYIRKEISFKEFEIFVENFDSPMVLFLKEGNTAIPAIIHTNRKEQKEIDIISDYGSKVKKLNDIPQDEFLKTESGEIIFLSVFAYESVVGSDITGEQDGKKLTPVMRLYRLLMADKKDIMYVYIYGVIIGITSLILPLGIQAAIELISGGVFFSSIYFLIAVVILGVLGSGVLQVLQITIVEYLQRRVFTKAAFEFAFRVPRIKMEAVLNLHFPELMNRFFDVLTIQKGLPKLLIDLSTGLIQILFGLLFSVNYDEGGN